MSSVQAAHVLVLEHAPQESRYVIARALESAGQKVRVCRTWAGDHIPDTLADVVALVVMGGPMTAYADFPGRMRELALLRAALEADVPVLGVCLGAQLLAVAAGAAARRGIGAQIGWGAVGMNPAANTDPLFAGVPERLRVLHWHADATDLPSGATLLASCDRYPVQAFRIGGSAWGLQFHLDVDETAVDAFVAACPDEAAIATDVGESAPPELTAFRTELTALARHRDDVFARFAGLVADRAAMMLTRTFFTPRAATWEERYAADGARYAAAVSRMGLRPGSEPWTWAAAAAAPYRRCAPRSVTRASGSVWTSPRPCWWPQRGKVEPAWQGCCWPTPAGCRCRPARWTASSAQDWSTMSPPPQRHCASGPE